MLPELGPPWSVPVAAIVFAVARFQIDGDCSPKAPTEVQSCECETA